MRVQVKYPGAQPHEVELLGRVSIVGRDPSCDLVLHDVKCSRRHAVLETGPDGVTVRDSGSANGILVNGRRVERAVLRGGDTISLGEVQIVLLPEPPSTEATLLTPSPAGFASATPPPPPPVTAAPPYAPPAPPAAPPAPTTPMASTSAPPSPPRPESAAMPAAEPAAPRGSYAISGSTQSGKVTAGQIAEAAAGQRATPAERPLTVTVLAVLWMASVLLYLATGIGGLVAAGGIVGGVSVAVGGGLALVSAVMALGLWKVMPWARIAQIVIAGLGALTCSFTLPSVAVIVYMFRPAVRARFAAGRGPGDTREGLFTGLILGTVLLSVLFAAGGWALVALGLTGSRVE